MNAQEIIQVIQSVGFPIVMCGVMGWYVKYITDKHNTETDNLRQAIENSTQIANETKTLIQTFMDYMAKMKEGN